MAGIVRHAAEIVVEIAAAAEDVRAVEAGDAGAEAVPEVGAAEDMEGTGAEAGEGTKPRPRILAD